MFTFNPALALPLDRVRQRVGDTDVNNVEFQDETISAYLLMKPSEISVAHQLALDAVAKYSRLVDVTVDHQLTKASQAAIAYQRLADRLWAEMVRENAADGGSGFAGVGCFGVGTGPTEGYGGFDYPGIVPLCVPNPAITDCGC